MTTKEKILEEAMKLFAIKGFKAVSVRAIAAEVGVRDSALYKHFKSKQEIFDAIVEESKEKFINKYKEVGMPTAFEGDLVQLCMSMFTFQIEDPWIVRFRRMLILEHFNSPEVAKLYMQMFIEMPIKYQTQIFQDLIEKKIMRDKNAEVMAMELYAPFFLYHTVDTDMKKIKPLLKKHVENFVEAYME